MPGYAQEVDIIVTGGAGYIGAHIVNHLLSAGHQVIVIDDLSTGKTAFIDKRAIFIEGKVQDSNTLDKAFQKITDPENSGVIHAAGLKFAGESLKAPLAFYETNTYAVLELIKVMKKTGVRNLVFSSSSSVYGNLLESESATETSHLAPVSPYGRSKLFAENIIEDSKLEFPLRAVSLRYFNVIGNGEISALDTSTFNLLPNLYRAMEKHSTFKVFGGNYPTFDGSCIRDYVDVQKLAEAHAYALISLSEGAPIPPAINLGSGTGFSILEVIEIARQLINQDLDIEIVAGRPGDPARIVADCQLAETYLSWKTEMDIKNVILSGWKAWQKSRLA